MFGTLGMQEMVFLFILALLLFGPKKLPELGRQFGKAMTEFRRASNELKATFDREMKTLEQETESIKEVARDYQYDNYNYDYSSYESTYEGAYGSEAHDSSAATTPTLSASEIEGAQSPIAALPEGTIPHDGHNGSGSDGHALEAGHSNGSESHALPAPGDHGESTSATVEHKA